MFPRGKATRVVVDLDFAVSRGTTPPEQRMLYGHSPLTAEGQRILWPSILEKAFAIAAGGSPSGYNAIESNDSAYAMRTLLGDDVKPAALFGAGKQGLEARLSAAIAAHEPITLARHHDMTILGLEDGPGGRMVRVRDQQWAETPGTTPDPVLFDLPGIIAQGRGEFLIPVASLEADPATTIQIFDVSGARPPDGDVATFDYGVSPSR
jgi:hypothetical protein